MIPAARGQHINVKELRGLFELERRTARLMSSARLLVGSGFASRSRSSSERPSLATMLGADLYIYLGLAFLVSETTRLTTAPEVVTFGCPPSLCLPGFLLLPVVIPVLSKAGSPSSPRCRPAGVSRTSAQSSSMPFLLLLLLLKKRGVENRCCLSVLQGLPRSHFVPSPWASGLCKAGWTGSVFRICWRRPSACAARRVLGASVAKFSLRLGLRLLPPLSPVLCTRLSAAAPSHEDCPTLAVLLLRMS